MKQEIKPAAGLAEIFGTAFVGSNSNTANVDQKQVTALSSMAREAKDRAQIESMLL